MIHLKYKNSKTLGNSEETNLLNSMSKNEILNSNLT